MRPNWFVALPVDPAGWYPARVADPPPGFRRFHPDDLHLTVAFLGGVDEATARAAWAAAPAAPDFETTLGPVVPLGNPRQGYTALAATLESGRTAVEGWMGRAIAPMRAAAGLAPERRPPLAHCTLARPGRRADAGDRRLGLDWAAALDLGGVRLRLDRLALYTWSADRTRRQFRIVAQSGPARGL